MKKIVALLLSAIMLIGSMSILASAEEFRFSFDYEDAYTVGDANSDTYVDARDVLSIRRRLVDSGYALTEGAADVNCDSTIDARDVLALRRSFVGALSLADYDNPAQIDKFTIAGVDISEFTIVIPEDVAWESNDRYISERLQYYIKSACNVELPISRGMPADGGHVITLTQYDELSAEAIEMNLGIENYTYEVKNGNLNIYGTRRGCMYSVYEILEDFLGFRFYADEYSFVKEIRTVDIPEGYYVHHEPELSFRFVDQGYEKDGVETHYFPSRLNGTQIYVCAEFRFGTETGPHFINAHSYGYYWRMATGDKDASSYEDKYASGTQQKESQWNPCSTSDDDYEYLFRGMLETMRMIQGWSHVFRRETSSMSFSICDNAYICPCRNCSFISGTGTDKRLGERLGAGGSGLNLYLANRAAKDVTAYYPGRAADNDEFGEVLHDEYPGMKVYSIIYEHTPPVTNLPEEWKDKILPAENLILMYCGTACNNHYLKDAATECGTSKNNLNGNCARDVESLKAWGTLCYERGAEMWFWFYPVNYNAYLVDSPVIFNIYYDFKYMIEECHVTGIYYEGGGEAYQFQYLKSYLASRMMWEPHMSFEKYVQYMKDFLSVNYGDGYEELYQYIVLKDEAANAIKYTAGNNTSGCFINNFDRPGDMYDYEYTRDHYVEMRNLLIAAYDKAKTDDQRRRIEYLYVECDFMGITANYESWYLNGTPEEKQLYAERYEWMFNFIKDNNMHTYSDDVYPLPETLDLSVKPTMAYILAGSWNKNNENTWGAMEGGSWGFQDDD